MMIPARTRWPHRIKKIPNTAVPTEMSSRHPIANTKNSANRRIRRESKQSKAQSKNAAATGWK